MISREGGVAKYKYFIGAIMFLLIFLPKNTYANIIKIQNAPNTTNNVRDAILKKSKEGDTILFSSGNWRVDTLYFVAIKNRTILFENGASLIANKGAFVKEDNTLMRFASCDGIKLIGLGKVVFKMQKKEYTFGEMRGCIAFWGCNNIDVRNIAFENSGGDGVFINNCVNVSINNCIMNNNRRNGISVISAKNLIIDSCLIENSNGTFPEAGIDFEPAYPQNYLTNCTVKNSTIYNNHGSGISVSVQELNSKSIPISIKIENCNVDGNRRQGLVVYSLASCPSGSVTIDNCKINNSYLAEVAIAKPAIGFELAFKHCSFLSINSLQINNLYAPIIIEGVDKANKNGIGYGGVSFDSCKVTYSSPTSVVTYRNQYLNQRNKTFSPFIGKVDRVSGTIFISNPYLKTIKSLQRKTIRKGANLKIQYLGNPVNHTY